MKTRGSSNVRQSNGRLSQRKQTVKPCAICGWNFMGRAEVKACSPECTTALRKFSAKNRNHHP